MEFRSKVKKLLMKLQTLEGVEGCLAATRNGNVLENLMPYDVDATRLAAMAASMLGAAEVAAETVRRGIIHYVSLEVEGGTIMIMGAGSKAFLILLTSKSSLPPLLKSLEATCKEIAEALS